MPEPVSVAIARLCFPDDREHCRVGSWLAATMLSLQRDKERVRRWAEFPVNKQPSDAASNTAAEVALQAEADILIKSDNDHVHDYLHGPTFWETAFDFWWKHDGPCIIAAPACNSRGEVCVYREDGRFVPPELAAVKTGIERVPASGLSLCLIDCRVFRMMEPPYFAHTYNDKRTELASDENAQFTVRAGQVGVPTYCIWQCWSAHAKSRLIGKPVRQ